jgi:hypothetical protein
MSARKIRRELQKGAFGPVNLMRHQNGGLRGAIGTEKV